MGQGHGIGVAAVLAGTFALSDAPTAAQAQTAPSKLVRVEGNRFVDRAGRQVIFRGVSAPDPAHLVQKGQWTQRYFAAMRSWGANVVRIPLFPSSWRELGRERCLALLDQAIEWTAQNDQLVILDWHVIGNPRTELSISAEFDTTRKETLDFWRVVSDRYKDNPRVFLYEIYNEPTDRDGRLGELSWSDWKLLAEEVVKIIFAHDPGAIPLVPGLDWGFDLTGVANAPLAVPGVAYSVHPYSGRRPEPWPERWQADWGFVKEKYPLFATEFGFDPQGPPTWRADSRYGRIIVDFLEKKGISWTAWCFDPDWAPALLRDWSFNPTEEGALFKAALTAARAETPKEAR